MNLVRWARRWTSENWQLRRCILDGGTCLRPLRRLCDFSGIHHLPAAWDRQRRYVAARYVMRDMVHDAESESDDHALLAVGLVFPGALARPQISHSIHDWLAVHCDCLLENMRMVAYDSIDVRRLRQRRGKRALHRIRSRRVFGSPMESRHDYVRTLRFCSTR